MGSPAEEGLEIALDFIYSIVASGGVYCYDCPVEYYAKETLDKITNLEYGLLEIYHSGKVKQRQGETR